MAPSKLPVSTDKSPPFRETEVPSIGGHLIARRRRPLLLWSVLVVGVIACSSPRESALEGSRCERQWDCSSGLACVAGRCEMSRLSLSGAGAAGAVTPTSSFSGWSNDEGNSGISGSGGNLTQMDASGGRPLGGTASIGSTLGGQGAASGGRPAASGGRPAASDGGVPSAGGIGSGGEPASGGAPTCNLGGTGGAVGGGAGSSGKGESGEPGETESGGRGKPKG